MTQITQFKPLDKYLVENGLVATLPRAHELIQNGSVKINGAVITAPVCPVYAGHKIEILGVEGPWVNPQAEKLSKALDALNIEVKGRVAADIGAGEGGFTEVLIQRGIKIVFAVDKEFGLLHPSLSLHQRVKNLQRTQSKDLNASHFDKEFTLAVVDIGDDGIAEEIAPLFSLISIPADILVFFDDRLKGKDFEKSLRLQHGFIAKKIPESLQKGSYLVWAHKAS